MSKGTIVGIVGVLLLAVVFSGVYFKRLGIMQQEIALSNRFEAQENVVETSLFNMRTAIKNIHSCTDEWADKFIAVVASQAKGRPGNAAGQGGSGGLMALGGTGYKEADSLGIPSDMYAKLSNAIEGHLGDFTRQQNLLTDVWRSHKTYCQDPKINSFWNVPLLAKVKDRPQMITSAATKTAVETKQMDEALF
jgi:hypothetical protein